MGDSLIVRRGGSGSSSRGKLKSVIITQDTEWVVPKAKDQMFMVRIFGGGQSGGITRRSYPYGNVSQTPGGAGGFMNNAILTLKEGESIPITIGQGGMASQGDARPGKSTFFGPYLSAYGGAQRFSAVGGSGGGHVFTLSSPSAGSKTGAGIGYQFGGGGGYNVAYAGGRGGQWGGGGGIFCNGISFTASNIDGAGGCLYNTNDSFYNSEYWSINPFLAGYSGLAGNGGLSSNYKYNSGYGIQSGGSFISPESGTDTSNDELPFDCSEFTGKGKAGESSFIIDDNLEVYSGGTINEYRRIYNLPGGGGGYGGNGGKYCGGGGGYGGNGGNNIGGGGGYGADGGDGSFSALVYWESSSMKWLSNSPAGGGGGGYGPSGKGGNAEIVYNSGGTITRIPAEDGGYAAGGGGYGYRDIDNKPSPSNGGNGICIITYYE